MLKRSSCSLRYIGGAAVNHPILGTNMKADHKKIIGVEKAVVSNDWNVQPESMSGNFHQWRWDDSVRELRGDLYDELLKLPLRYKLHPYDRLHGHMSHSAVGYAPPLGPVDYDDTIPFFVHRDSNGRFLNSIRSIDAKIGASTFVMTLGRIDGDLFRFEDELIKIFPQKKIFVHANFVRVFSAAEDAKAITEHWLLGLGF